MNRRDVLTAGSAAALMPCAVASRPMPTSMAPTDGNDTPILRLFRRHREIINSATAHDFHDAAVDEDEELERIFYQEADRIEDEMMALPCTCAADLAAKLIVDSCCGVAFTDWKTGPLWIEARALAGFTDHRPVRRGGGIS